MNLSLIKPDGYLITTPGPIVPITGLTAETTGSAATFSGFSTTSVNFGLTRPNGVFQGFIQAMIDENILKSHAQPMIIAHNGRAANLLSGGEVPIPTAAGLGTVGVEYREFGIQMNAVPYILGNGRVRLEVETIVRDKDLANSVTIQGNLTPGFKTNSANTQVEMNFGEALVIAGLVSRREIGIGQKLPFVGELPWIGAAFSRKSYEESETELIILVTPELVAAMPANQLPSKGPGQFTDMPVNRELFAYGLFEVPLFGDACEACPDCTAFGHCSQYPDCQRCETGSAVRSGAGSVESCAPVSSTRVVPSAQTQKVSPVSKTRVPDVPAAARSGSNEAGGGAARNRSGGTGSSGLITPTMR
jgi:pilus assembly protein CpaC